MDVIRTKKGMWKNEENNPSGLRNVVKHVDRFIMLKAEQKRQSHEGYAEGNRSRIS
jgi:hypothetical protein